MSDALIGAGVIAFDRVLRSWLEPHEYAAVLARNAVEPNPSICHSHDYIDANECMVEALELVLGRRLDHESDDDVRLWNRTWNQWRQ